MSKILAQVRELVDNGEVRISLHGYEELGADGIRVRDVVEGLLEAVVVEDYPEYHKGPSVLVLERDSSGQPIHVVWGIPVGQDLRGGMRLGAGGENESPFDHKTGT